MGAELLAAVDADAVVDEGVGGEQVDGEVEAHAGCVAADGGGAEDDAFHGAGAGEEDLFAFQFAGGVAGHGGGGGVFGDIALAAGAVDAGGAGEDEAVDSGALGGADDGAEGVEVDGAGEGGVEVVAGVVGDAGEVDDDIGSAQGVGDARGIADVEAVAGEAGVMGVGAEDVVAIPEEVEDADGVPEIEEARDEGAADMAGATDHRNRQRRCIHGSGRKQYVTRPR